MSNQAVRKPAGDSPRRAETDSYPGKQFGLPEEGPRSVAGVGRRLGALVIELALPGAQPFLATLRAGQLGR